MTKRFPAGSIAVVDAKSSKFSLHYHFTLAVSTMHQLLDSLPPHKVEVEDYEEEFFDTNDLFLIHNGLWLKRRKDEWSVKKYTGSTTNSDIIYIEKTFDEKNAATSYVMKRLEEENVTVPNDLKDRLQPIATFKVQRLMFVPTNCTTRFRLKIDNSYYTDERHYTSATFIEDFEEQVSAAFSHKTAIPESTLQYVPQQPARSKMGKFLSEHNVDHYNQLVENGQFLREYKDANSEVFTLHEYYYFDKPTKLEGSMIKATKFVYDNVEDYEEWEAASDFVFDEQEDPDLDFDVEKDVDLIETANCSN